MTKSRLIQQLAMAVIVLWGNSVLAQDAAATNSLLQDAQKAAGAAAPAAAAPAIPAPVPEAPAAPAPVPETPVAPAMPVPAAPAPAAEATPAPVAPAMAPDVPATPAPTTPPPAPVPETPAPAEGTAGQPPIVPPKEMQATTADAKELQLQEELRRKALKQQADKEDKAGDLAMKDGHYLDAAESYKLCVAHMRQVGTAAYLGSVSNKIAEAYGRAAQDVKKADKDTCGNT
jgi:hypothetical protein